MLLVHALVACVSSETCGEHKSSGVALDRRSHHRYDVSCVPWLRILTCAWVTK
jgi:hypothetical protein